MILNTHSYFAKRIAKLYILVLTTFSIVLPITAHTSKPLGLICRVTFQQTLRGKPFFTKQGSVQCLMNGQPWGTTYKWAPQAINHDIVTLLGHTGKRSLNLNNDLTTQLTTVKNQEISLFQHYNTDNNRNRDFEQVLLIIEIISSELGTAYLQASFKSHCNTLYGFKVPSLSPFYSGYSNFLSKNEMTSIFDSLFLNKLRLPHQLVKELQSYKKAKRKKALAIGAGILLGAGLVHLKFPYVIPGIICVTGITLLAAEQSGLTALLFGRPGILNP